MNITILIPTALRAFTDGKSEIKTEGEKVGQVIENFVKTYPDIKAHLYDEKGFLRSFINVFVGEKNVKNLQGLDTVLKDGDVIMIVPAIAGGRG